eukprot:TRINITY_DN39783_c0_g1_i1.p1 TRINITY_DN39783_c0_g1~~TRINITY_DN39783_c0_g1_i1.p1  ORF type:complete len:472 (+),score=112.83 TRINITY_DN39783_c0_g1_i1:41-1417(+)
MPLSARRLTRAALPAPPLAPAEAESARPRRRRPRSVWSTFALCAARSGLAADLLAHVLAFARLQERYEWYAVRRLEGGPFRRVVTGPVSAFSRHGGVYCFGGYSATEPNSLWRMAAPSEGMRWEELHRPRTNRRFTYLAAQLWGGSEVVAVCLRHSLTDGPTPILKYQWPTREWRAEAVPGRWPPERGGYTLTALPQGLAVFGGDSAGVLHGDAWLLRCSPQDANHWSPLPRGLHADTAPPARTCHAAASTVDSADQGRLWISGGRCRGFHLDDLWCWEACSGWQLKSGSEVAPEPRSEHLLAAHHDQLIMYGGVSTTGCLGDLWMYSVVLDMWRSVATVGSLPPARRMPCGAVRGGELVVFGGRDRHGQALVDAHALTLVGLDSVGREHRRSTAAVLAKRAVQQGIIDAAIHGCYHQRGESERPSWRASRRRARQPAEAAARLPSKFAWRVHIDRGY